MQFFSVVKVFVLLLSSLIIFLGCSGTHELQSEGEYSESGRLLCAEMGERECEMHQLINEERVSRGLEPFSPSTNCVQAAQYHAEHMNEFGYFSHDSPGETFSERMDRFGIGGFRAENIATGSEVLQVVEAWMSSSGHRANILNPNLRYSGIGMSGNKWVQCFTGHL